MDYALYVCTRKISDVTTPPTQYFDFGGMWGTSGGFAWYEDVFGPRIKATDTLDANPYTGGQSCPAGYTQTQVLGTPNVDYTLYYCWKARTTAPTLPSEDFGGLWGMRATTPGVWGGTNYNNPVTGAATCPTGYTTKIGW